MINPYMLSNPNVIKITMSPTSNFQAGITLVFAPGTLTIDWKDGSAPENFISGTEKFHTYVTAGTYVAEISGNLLNITQFTADACRITHIENFKTGTLTQLNLNGNLISGLLDLRTVANFNNANVYLSNAGLTNIISNPNWTGTIYQLHLQGSSLAGTLDLSKIGITSAIFTYNCINLTNIVYRSYGNGTMRFHQCYNCNLTYINYAEKGFSLAANDRNIQLQNNNMTAEEVNHILVDLNNIAQLGYTGRSIIINGSNASPDSLSGGYDGLTAKASLISKGFSVLTS